SRVFQKFPNLLMDVYYGVEEFEGEIALSKRVSCWCQVVGPGFTGPGSLIRIHRSKSLVICHFSYLISHFSFSGT
ncbi:MAG TPA: hypothetical protein VIR01_14610, partial [Pyrinomonadaceae bacterium]